MGNILSKGQGLHTSVLVALDPVNAKMIWTLSFTGSGSVFATDMAIGSNGNIYVLGTFQRNLSVGGQSLSKKDSQNDFVACISQDGKVQWLTHIHGGADYYSGVWSEALTVDAGGNCYVAGQICGTSFFGDKNLSTGKLAIASYGSQYSKECFVAVFSPSGACSMVNSIITYASVSAIICQGNNLVVCGSFQGVMTKGADEGASVFGGKDKKSANRRNNKTISETLYIASFTKTCELNWVFSAPGPAYSNADNMTVDKNNNLWICINFFDDISLADKKYEASGAEFNSETALLKMDQSGVLLQSFVWQGAGPDRIATVESTQTHVICAGYFGKMIKCGSETMVSAKGVYSGMVLKKGL